MLEWLCLSVQFIYNDSYQLSKFQLKAISVHFYTLLLNLTTVIPSIIQTLDNHKVQSPSTHIQSLAQLL